MRDIDSGNAEVLLHLFQLIAELDAEFSVKIGERLIHTDNSRLRHKSTGYRNTLLLTAGELGHCFLQFLVRQIDFLGNFSNFRINLCLFQLFDLEAERDVIIHRHRREKSIALEHNTNIPVFNRNMSNILPLHYDRTGNRLNETGDGTQSRRFPTSRWPEKGKKFTFFDMHIDVMQSCKVSEFYYNIIEPDHTLLHFFPSGNFTKKAGWFPNPPYNCFSDYAAFWVRVAQSRLSQSGSGRASDASAQ